jgi:hypothetical protein
MTTKRKIPMHVEAGVQYGEANDISRLLDTGLRRHDGLISDQFSKTTCNRITTTQ